jgi:hypothetical protein
MEVGEQLVSNPDAGARLLPGGDLVLIGDDESEGRFLSRYLDGSRAEPGRRRGRARR